jgi:hypothetical protein
MDRRTLLVVIDERLWNAVDGAAQLAELTKRRFMEATIARLAGRTHEDSAATERAWRRYRKMFDGS